MIDVYFENHMKYTNALRWLDPEYLMVQLVVHTVTVVL
jgi:hypothetical protein